MVGDPPLVGHKAGKKNTYAWITWQFYWLGTKMQVQKYCTSCPECQLTQPKGKKSGLLKPIPIVAVPFQRLDIDIVGPLPRAFSWHQYILVMLNNATHYPKVVPLHNIKTPIVAQELAVLFSHLEIPKQVVTNQRTNFMNGML